MNNEIINTLVEVYKSKGASLHELLRDPIFLSLPVEKQVDVVNGYASVIAQGGKAPRGGRIMTRAILTGVAGGLFASVPFMSKYTVPETRAAIGLAGGFFGGLAGAVSGVNLLRAEKDRFEKTNKYLIRLSHSPEVPNAVRVLDIHRKYEPKTLTSIVRRLASPEQSLIEKSVGLSGGFTENTFKQFEPK